LRVFYVGNFTYWFLPWNLFLAFIPYILSLFLYQKYLTNFRKPAFWLLFLIWFVFFPNAPYIITDFVHLGNWPTIVPKWFDAILLFSSASTGLLLGFFSLRLLQHIFVANNTKLLSWFFVFTTLFCSSFGIYIGRFLKWNSWDVLSNPLLLFRDIFWSLGSLEMWCFTGVLFGFLALGYILFITLALRQND